MNILISLITISILWCAWCWWLYKRRTKEVIIVDFDSVIADSSVVLKRAEVYLQNKPEMSVEDYVAVHINEQKPIESGIKRVWDLQQKSYKIVFLTNLKEYLRPQVATFLNKWDLRGELYMHELDNVGVAEKILLVQMHRLKKFKVIGLLDWSNDAIEVHNNIGVKLL